jgi:hypothetical protein
MVIRAANTIVSAALALGLVLLATLASSPSASAQDSGDGMEEFAEVDPYTKGERELMDKLGYTTFAPFPWRDAERTPDVHKVIGGAPMIWVETEHFRIGSTLGTYDIPNDSEEKSRISDEVAQLKKRLGKLKTSKKEVDPWLRLHLYAQRAEELYVSFLTDFGLTDEDFGEKTPHLGNSKKYLLLLFERKSELGRYLRAYLDAENDYSYRWGWEKETMFYGANIEAIRASWTNADNVPFDAQLFCAMTASLATNFVDSYKGSFYSAPRWLGSAIGHVYTRRIDPRWVTAAGHDYTKNRREDDWMWESRVRNLVGNDFFATTEQMFAWQEYSDMNERDHMVAWSKLDWLMRVAKGDLEAFMASMCTPTAEVETGTKEELLARQKRALLAHFSLTPAEMDAAWAKWVKKTYRKK